MWTVGNENMSTNSSKNNNRMGVLKLNRKYLKEKIADQHINKCYGGTTTHILVYPSSANVLRVCF